MNPIYIYECKYNLHHGLNKGFTDVSSTSRHTGEGKYFTLQDAIERFKKDATEIHKDGFVFMNDNIFQLHRSENLDERVIIEDIKRVGLHISTMISRDINASPMYTYLITVSEREITSPLDALRGAIKSWL